jgi:hypothetical protein
VVLDTVAKKHLGFTIVPLNGNRNSDESFRPFAAFSHRVIQLQKISRAIKLRGRHLKDFIIE